MVLESIVVPSQWENHPGRMFFIGFAYSSIGLFLGLSIFGRYASLAGVFLTTMPLVVIMYRAIRCEEAKDLRMKTRMWCMGEHTQIFSFFMYLFIGMVVSYSLWFVVLPQGTVDKVFDSQIDTIQSIVGTKIGVSGDAISKGLESFDRLYLILKNNFKVLVFCILFSFLYGAGAIFILTWNASVIGVAVGNVIRSFITKYGNLGRDEMLYNYFKSFPISFSYMIHGIPEIGAYFLGALAGGIISVAVVNHDYRSREFLNIVFDSVELLILSALTLLAAGLIEVYVTPALF